MSIWVPLTATAFPNSANVPRSAGESCWRKFQNPPASRSYTNTRPGLLFGPSDAPTTSVVPSNARDQPNAYSPVRVSFPSYLHTPSSSRTNVYTPLLPNGEPTHANGAPMTATSPARATAHPKASL